MGQTAKTVYFHGMPGSPAELTLFPAAGRGDWLAIDRAGLYTELTARERFDRLAKSVLEHASGAPVRIVAFSLGTYVALEVASRLPSVQLTLDLVSPAAPLQLGAFIDDMAGGTIFSLAARRPHVFGLLALAQSLAARWIPAQLAAALFASAKGADVDLWADEAIRAGIAAVLRTSLTRNANYVAEVSAYVGDWSAILPTIRQPVTLWQGDADNWTPPAMAAALAQRLPNVRAHQVFPGLSHYSTLRQALSQLT